MSVTERLMSVSPWRCEDCGLESRKLSTFKSHPCRTFEDRALAAARLVSMVELTDDREDLAALTDELADLEDEDAREERADEADRARARRHVPPDIRRYRVKLKRSPEAVARHSAECEALGVPGSHESDVDMWVRAEIKPDGSVRRWGASRAVSGNTVLLNLWLEPAELVEVERQIREQAHVQRGLFA